MIGGQSGQLPNQLQVAIDAPVGGLQKSRLPMGAFTHDVGFLGRYVGKAASDFTKQTCVLSKVYDYLGQVQVGQKCPKNI